MFLAATRMFPRSQLIENIVCMAKDSTRSLRYANQCILEDIWHEFDGQVSPCTHVWLQLVMWLFGLGCCQCGCVAVLSGPRQSIVQKWEINEEKRYNDEYCPGKPGYLDCKKIWHSFFIHSLRHDVADALFSRLIVGNGFWSWQPGLDSMNRVYILSMCFGLMQHQKPSVHQSLSFDGLVLAPWSSLKSAKAQWKKVCRYIAEAHGLSCN